MKKIFSVLLLVFLLAACSSNSKKELKITKVIGKNYKQSSFEIEVRHIFNKDNISLKNINEIAATESDYLKIKISSIFESKAKLSNYEFKIVKNDEELINEIGNGATPNKTVIKGQTMWYATKILSLENINQEEKENLKFIVLDKFENVKYEFELKDILRIRKNK